MKSQSSKIHPVKNNQDHESVDRSIHTTSPRKRKLNLKLKDFPELKDMKSFHSVINSKETYECRTVNSIETNRDDMEKHNLLEQTHIKSRKHKDEIYDSEVDLFKKNYNNLKPTRFHGKIRKPNMDDTTEQPENNYLLPVSKSGPTKVNLPTKKLSGKDPIKKTTSAPPIKGNATRKKVEQEVAGPGDATDKYEVLKNEELKSRFLKVPMSNNQKGRIRQVMREVTKGAPPQHLPDVLNNKIQHILKKSDTLTDSDLRQIRILFNMLNTVTANKKIMETTKVEPNKKKKKDDDSVAKKIKHGDEKETAKKAKKRYVVFVGNLPKDVTKEQLMWHFADLGDFVKSIRIPTKKSEQKDKNSAIAYVELSTGTSYEMALAKHRTMLGNRRISVVYTAPKNSKLSKAQAKSKAAKLTAMGKNGQLVGSIPLNKKRSHRRAIAKKAKKAAEEAQNLS